MFGHDTAIRTRTGARVRLTMVNETMMAHPMHIQGHTWSLPGNGGLRKDTVLVLPMQTFTADLQADNRASGPTTATTSTTPKSA